MSNDNGTRVALVTGGSRGIGRAISERLAREGYSVVVNYHSRHEAAEETCAAIREAGRAAWAIQADVLKADEVRSLFDAIRERHGRLDVLVNNAGRSHEALFALTPPDRFWEILQANIMGTVLCSQAALRLMLRQRKGVIVNISSVAGVRAPVGLSAYASAKAAINALTISMAREVAGRGIRVNAVAPSWVETEMTERSNQKSIVEGLRRIPLARMARAEEVAAAVSAIVRDDMSYLVGQVIVLDGGGVV
jgi:3-oxoacyl-[acyl-carrier protein] reductase